MIRQTYIFDTPSEIEFKAEEVENILLIDDPSKVNPFVSGSVETINADGVINGDLTSGFISDTMFNFSVSGEPYRNESGSVVLFDFNEPRKLYTIDVYQNNDNYAVDYRILGDNNSELIVVRGSKNSGLISHKFSNPTETNKIAFETTAINNNLNKYHILEISGEATRSFIEEKILSEEIAEISATSVVEPVENLFDNNSLTFWQSNNSFPQVISIEFEKEENVSEVRYISEDSSTFPTEWKMETSLDGSDFFTLSEKDFSNPVTSGDVTIDLNNVRTTKYLKWTINAGVGNKVRIRELIIKRKILPQLEKNTIQLKNKVTNSILNPLSLSAGTQNTDNVISNVVENDQNFWQSENTFTYNSGLVAYLGQEYVLVDLGEEETIHELSWSNNTGAGIAIDYKLSGSNDNITYSDILIRTGNSQTEGVKKFEDSVYKYRFYKLSITKSTDEFVRFNHISLKTRAFPEESNVLIPAIEADKVKSVVVNAETPFPATSLRYILQINGTKYWWDGSRWVESDGTATNSNDLETINNNLKSLDESFGENFKIATNILLLSDGTETPVIKTVEVETENSKNSVFIPNNMIRIKGFISGFPGVLSKPIEMNISLRRSSIVVEGETLGFAATVIKSDNSGYFDFLLPQTENANPEKARYSITIPQMNLRRERYTPAISSLSLSDWLSNNF